VPDATDLLRSLRHHRERLRQHLRHRLRAAAQRADHARARLAQQQPRTRLRAGGERLGQLRARLQRQHPTLLLERHRNDLRLNLRSLRSGLAHRLEARALQLGELARALNAVSPLATLQRGYAILLEAESGRIVRSTTQAIHGSRLTARVHDGEFDVRVESRRG